MVEVKSMLRFLALLVLLLWAQNASAASFSCTGGNIYWNKTGFVNTTTSACTYDIGTVYAPGGATQDGYTIITSPHLALNVSGITVTFINNGAPYAPTSKSLSCFIGVGTPGLGPFGATINTPMANTVTANSITANFPAFALSEGYYNLDCTVNYVNAAGESVSHKFLGSGYQPAIGVVGNASTYGTSTVNITAAPVEPSVALAGLSGTIGAGAQTVTATFSKEVTGFTAADLSLTNASVSNFLASSTSVYTFDITPAATGAVSVQVPAGSVTDLAGNANTASNTLSAAADLTPPRVSFSGLPAPALLYTGVTQTITATFSEAVTGFTLSDLVAVGATVSNFVVVNPTTYRFDALPTGATAVSIGVSLLSVSDLVGNLNSIADPAFTARNAGQPTPISASFTITPSAGVSSVIAVFTDTSTPTSSLTLTSWAWDFGDGNTSTLQNPAHYYTTQGVYTVTLQACDRSGCSTATGTVTVSNALSSLTSTLSGLTGPIGPPPNHYRGLFQRFG